jgi:hypothetical protein
VSSFVQPAALTIPLRAAASAADIDIDDLRTAVLARTDEDAPELQRLRRLSIGRVLLLIMVVVATSALLSSIADIGLDTIIDAMLEASGPLLLLAFMIGLTPRVANAVGLSAVAPSRVCSSWSRPGWCSRSAPTSPPNCCSAGACTRCCGRSDKTSTTWTSSSSTSSWRCSRD